MAKILLVEDQFIIQQIQLAMFKQLGYEAEVATTGSEALKKANNQVYDLIFMDMCLPDMDGTDVTKQLRVQGIQTPIVAITGNDDEPSRIACRESGMNGFLPKPMTSAQLKTVLEHYLQT